MRRSLYIFEHNNEIAKFFMEFLVGIKVEHGLFILGDVLGNEGYFCFFPVFLDLCKLALDNIFLGGLKYDLADLRLNFRKIGFFDNLLRGDILLIILAKDKFRFDFGLSNTFDHSFHLINMILSQSRSG